MSIELKIKSKHLGVEAQIIRFEERKLLKGIAYRRSKHKAAGNNTEYKAWDDENWRHYYSLNRHRKWDVRNENRATFLARAYIAGVPYSKVEQKRKNESLFNRYIVPRIVNMVAKYGADKVPVKIYDRTKGGYIDNPELAKLKQAVTEWIKTAE
jgi:hypothetical protein